MQKFFISLISVLSQAFVTIWKWFDIQLWLDSWKLFCHGRWELNKGRLIFLEYFRIIYLWIYRNEKKEYNTIKTFLKYFLPVFLPYLKRSISLHPSKANTRTTINANCNNWKKTHRLWNFQTISMITSQIIIILEYICAMCVHV